eukprot:IDg11063t1
MFHLSVGPLFTCNPCRLGKAHSLLCMSMFEPANNPDQIVHTDLSGPLPLSTMQSRYLCTFIDQATRHMMVVGLHRKSNAATAFEMYWCGGIVKDYPKGVQRLHSDGSGEFEFAADGVEHTWTTRDTPQHNPFAERASRTIFDPVRTLQEEAGLSAKYWEQAACHVAYVKICLYHKAIKNSSYQALTSQPPCSDDNGVFKCELITTRKFVYSRHVTFYEQTFTGLYSPDSSSDEDVSYYPDFGPSDNTLARRDSVSSNSDIDSDTSIDSIPYVR